MRFVCHGAQHTFISNERQSDKGELQNKNLQNQMKGGAIKRWGRAASYGTDKVGGRWEVALFFCWGWQVKMLERRVSRMSTLSPRASAGRSIRVRASASCCSAHTWLSLAACSPAPT